MSKTDRMSFVRRGVGELVVVVAGVLIALWADGLRQDRVDRVAEVEHLESLRADFATSLAELDSVLAEHNDQVASLERLLSGDLSRHLRVIKDTELRRGLAELDRILGLGAVEHADFTAVQHRLTDPFMAERLDLPSLFFGATARGRGVDLATTLESAEGRNVIAFKLALAPYDLAQRRGTQVQLGHLVGLIQRRLTELDADSG